MTTEEKAKAYDEALERAKGIHSFSSDIAEIKRMEQIFPELAESEDERIVNAIKKHLDMEKSERNLTGYFGVSYQEAVAWLEKQGEQKPTKNDAKMVGMGGLDMEWRINTLVKKACELFSEYWDGDPDIVEGVAIFEKRMKEFIRKCFYLKKS
jgi:hypothetical protein